MLQNFEILLLILLINKICQILYSNSFLASIFRFHHDLIDQNSAHAHHVFENRGFPTADQSNHKIRRIGPQLQVILQCHQRFYLILYLKMAFILDNFLSW